MKSVAFLLYKKDTLPTGQHGLTEDHVTLHVQRSRFLLSIKTCLFCLRSTWDHVDQDSLKSGLECSGRIIHQENDSVFSIVYFSNEMKSLKLVLVKGY